MAAQKLTRGRIVQICITMAVLIAAFVLRTIEYRDVQQVSCNHNQTCKLIYGGNNIELSLNSIDLQVTSDKSATFSVYVNEQKHTLTDGKLSLETTSRNIVLNDQSLNFDINVVFSAQ
ncbi:hypothetical protein [Vibrio maerlii]|uniref:hypothetical protein n=1 Tax=Vibrio maerlii TaxID=2231648 RepID=UPI000E3D000A|nr:hypothetical protein [Vibrio maerlii]